MEIKKKLAKQPGNDSMFYLVLVMVFAVLLPIAYAMGLVSMNTVSIWGRYFCFAIAAIGIDLIWGYTGILSMCQAFFFCLGGYGIAMYLTLESSGEGNIPAFMNWLQSTELPMFWQPFETFGGTLVMILIVPALIAGVFGFFVFRSRLRGVYFAIITQALALAVWLLFLRNETMLGGTNGLTNFKTILGFSLSEEKVKMTLYFISLGVLLLTYFLSKRLVQSKFGKLLVAIRDSESRVSYTAYKVNHYKLTVFVIAAVIAALGGMLYVPQTGIITPGRMDVMASIDMVMWVALGGRGKLKGALIGALAVNLLYSVCTSLFPGSWLYILGLLYILTVLYFDKGFVGLLELLKAKISRVKTSITINR